MKNIILFFCAFLFVMCKPAATHSATEIPVKKNVQYRDDFRSAPETVKKKVLQDLKAAEDQYSVLIFTKSYKGEKIVVTNEKATLYSGSPITNLKTGIAHKIRIENKLDTKIYDDYIKKEVVIDTYEAQKHKFIYLMKDPSNPKKPYLITYSNTLRPLD